MKTHHYAALLLAISAGILFGFPARSADLASSKKAATSTNSLSPYRGHSTPPRPFETIKGFKFVAIQGQFVNVGTNGPSAPVADDASFSTLSTALFFRTLPEKNSGLMVGNQGSTDVVVLRGESLSFLEVLPEAGYSHQLTITPLWDQAHGGFVSAYSRIALINLGKHQKLIQSTFQGVAIPWD